MDYEVLGLGLDGFELGNVAVQFACLCSYELVAFPDLDVDVSWVGYLVGRNAHLCLGIWLEEDGFDGFHFCDYKDRDDTLLKRSAFKCRRQTGEMSLS